MNVLLLIILLMLNAQLVEKGYIMRGDKNTYAAYHKQKGTLRPYAFYRTIFDGE